MQKDRLAWCGIPLSPMVGTLPLAFRAHKPYHVPESLLTPSVSYKNSFILSVKEFEHVAYVEGSAESQISHGINA